jgi:ubiquinone biosynthesis protein COQ9
MVGLPLAISVLAVASIRPTLQYVTGDILRYLPDAIWSDDSESKEQIIYASAASTILLPLIVSALTFYIFQQAWRALQTPDKR